MKEKGNFMAKQKNETGITIRIPQTLKRQADEIFDGLGLNTHAGIHLMLKQMALRGYLPFEVNLLHGVKKYDSDDKQMPVLIKTNEEIKNKCTEIAYNSGLNLSLVISMYLIQVIDKQAIPFKIVPQPNSSIGSISGDFETEYED